MGVDFAKLFKNNPVIYIDTNVYLYSLNSNNCFPDALQLLKEVAKRNIRAVTSALTLTEVLVHPFRLADRSLVAAHEEFVRGNGKIAVVAITDRIAKRAAEIRATHNLKTPDAIHLATAVDKKCQLFFTADKDFVKKMHSEIEIVVLPAKPS